jgi:hypothetical protein
MEIGGITLGSQTAGKNGGLTALRRYPINVGNLKSLVAASF